MLLSFETVRYAAFFLFFLFFAVRKQSGLTDRQTDIQTDAVFFINNIFFAVRKQFFINLKI